MVVLRFGRPLGGNWGVARPRRACTLGAVPDLRKVEELSGVGKVYRRDKLMFNTLYELEVWEGALFAGRAEPLTFVRGRIATEGVFLRNFSGRRVGLTLYLNDGRRLDFRVGETRALNPTSAEIVPAGRGLYAPES